MEKKESTVFKIPFAVIIFVAALALFIDGFVWFFVFNPLKSQLNRVENGVTVVEQKVVVTPTLEPTATPSATVTPVQKFFNTPRSVVTPVTK